MQPWQHGGTTDLTNLIVLCSGCHRALHEGAFTITALGGQTFAFSRGSAAWLPAPPTHGQSADLLRRDLDPTAIDPGWHGEPLDLGYATDVLLRAWHPETETTAAGTPPTLAAHRVALRGCPP